MKTIVIPFRKVNHLSEWKLKYTLRSFTNNLISKEDIEVILIGDRPMWFKGHHFPHKFNERVLLEPRAYDAAFKLEMLTRVMSKNFYLFYDDHCVLYPIPLETFDKPWWRDYVLDLEYVKTYGSDGEKYLAGAMQRLRQLMYSREIFNYECHYPRLLNPTQLKKVLLEYEVKNNRLPIGTVYFNHKHTFAPRELCVDTHNTHVQWFFGYEGAYSTRYPEKAVQMETAMKDASIANWGIKIPDHIKEFIEGEFDVPSKWEM